MGFLHDGSVDTLFRFFNATVFNEDGNVGFDQGDPQRRDMEQFVLAFDTDLAPIVGQQITLTADNALVANERINLFLERARTPFVSKILGQNVTECDVIAKVRIGERVRGYVLVKDGMFEPDDGSARISDSALRQLARTPGQEVTYTAVPPGSGRRMGVDRDGDGALDGNDNCARLANADQLDADEDGIGDACDKLVEDSGGCGCTNQQQQTWPQLILFGAVLLFVRYGRRKRC